MASGPEKMMRALIYEAKARPEFRDDRWSVDTLKDESLKAVTGKIPDTIKGQGSWNHAAVLMACDGVINGKWDLAREFFELIRRRGMNEYGPLYWILTAWCVEWCAGIGPEDVRVEARQFLGFLGQLAYKSAVEYPRTLELHLPDKTVGHDRTFQKPGVRFVATSAQRAVFGGNLAWQLEGLSSAWLYGEQTPRTTAFGKEELRFTDADAGFECGVTYEFNSPTQDPPPSGGFHLRTQMDRVRFQDGSLLIASGSGDHSTKPPIRVVDAKPGGVCRFFCPVPYKGHLHAKPSDGKIVIEGTKIYGLATHTDPTSQQVITTQKSRQRPLSSVTAWTRLTDRGDWQMIDPETQQPVDQEPPTEPPTTPPKVPAIERAFDAWAKLHAPANPGLLKTDENRERFYRYAERLAEVADR